MNESNITISGISKKYGSKQALLPSDLVINRGEIFGLIGPDGAGKTTFLRILTTLLLPDSGTANVLGFDIIKDFRDIRKILGYMPGRFSLYHDLSVEENLQFFATIFGTSLEKNYDLIKEIYIQLEPFRKRPAGKLSGGMKQKLALCCALIHKPQVLILDEPTTGVDAVSRKEFWEMLFRFKQEGLTILVSTPYMDEASKCDRIALIQNGKILGINTPRYFTDHFNHHIYSARAQQKHKIPGVIHAFDAAIQAYLFGQEIHIVSQKQYQSEQIEDYLKHNGFEDAVVKKTEPVTEDCFLVMMNSGSDGN